MSRPVVLIADDDEEVAALLKLYLRPLDAEVLVARDGEEALAIAQTRLPDAVLLDVMMPKRSGWEVCQALKAVQRTAHIGVILITGRGDVKDRLTGLQVGADDYLVKPLDGNEVLKRVAFVLKRSSEERGEAAQAGRTMLEAMLLDRATALPTLPVVLDRVKEILIEQGEIGVVFIDIEQIEAVESEYGWAFFDELLCNVGQIISAEAKSRFRNAIVTCHRTGGSSFYVFHETRGHDLSAESALERAAADLRQKLIESTRQRFPHIQPEQIGFFVGIARIDYRPQLRLERQI
jgi:PleD family two-component response regulator